MRFFLTKTVAIFIIFAAAAFYLSRVGASLNEACIYLVGIYRTSGSRGERVADHCKINKGVKLTLQQQCLWPLLFCHITPFMLSTCFSLVWLHTSLSSKTLQYAHREDAARALCALYDASGINHNKKETRILGDFRNPILPGGIFGLQAREHNNVNYLHICTSLVLTKL